ncbi:hypothetical protein GJ744_005455 [Endocarpon pusillum]|uniref:Uncharacterized protein n=1 Tax=Endocarpon pusillum TaxID=364733 RepID=A0A8H7A4P1_9EURO|nr:hypothetical protein GJ744_005455 [Endocarpon pusillum]
MNPRAEQSSPASQARHMRVDAESQTDEEKLRSENFIIKSENAHLNQKYKDTLAKNTKYRDKEESYEKKIATHLAEIARLEGRNRKTLLELDGTLMEVTRLKASKAVLEETCHKQCEEINAGEKRFDDYIQAVTNLTLHFRRSPPDSTIHGPSARAFRSGVRCHETENSRPADMNSLSSIPRTESGIISTPQLQQKGGETKATEITSSPVIKREHQDQYEYHLSEPTDATAFPRTSRTDLDVLPSVSDRVQAGHHSLSTTDEQEDPQRNPVAPEECSKKRARLPDEELGHLMDKRRRDEHSRYARRGSSKATDPRLQLRRR